jgi:hypothetical protein
MTEAAETRQNQSGRIIFVTGASRSGTTLLSRILGNHIEVLGLNELQFFGDLQDIDASVDLLDDGKLGAMAAMLLARQARDIWVDASTPEERSVASRLVAELPQAQRTGGGIYAATVAYMASLAGKTMVSEQTPRNIFYAGRLLELYPQARVVHIVRDPRGVLASQKNRWKVRKLGGKNVPIAEIIRLWFNYHPVTMSQLWRRATAAALALESHPRVTLVRFEDLVNNPEATVGELSNWLGLEFNAAMLDVPQWGSSNVRHNSEPKGVSKAMLGKWQDVLSRGEIWISERMTKQQMQHFEYVPAGLPGLPIAALALHMLKYPMHVLGAAASEPRRFLIQLKAILRTPGKAAGHE